MRTGTAFTKFVALADIRDVAGRWAGTASVIFFVSCAGEYRVWLLHRPP